MNKSTILRSTPHDTATKLSAVRTIRQLLAKGGGRWSVLTRVAKEHKVTAQTVSNWLNKYKDVTINLQKSNGRLTETSRNNHSDGFAIQSVNVRLTSGKEETLTPTDINNIASLAGTIC